MLSVVWTSSGNTLTFANGVKAGSELAPGQKFVFVGRAAGWDALQLQPRRGVAAAHQVAHVPAHHDGALASIISWIQTVCVEGLNSFTHTDNSQSPPFVKTVYLVDWRLRFEYWANPSTPIFSFIADLEDA